MGGEPEDPRPETPKVKMARADSTKESVIRLLEHVQNAS